MVAGQTAALALKKVKRNQVRKGMVLVDERAKPKASWEFDADIAILTHSTTIQPRYQVRLGPCTVPCDDVAVLLPISSSGEEGPRKFKVIYCALLACSIMLINYDVCMSINVALLHMQAVIHCEIVRQAARVVAMDKERLRSGDRACVRFRFLQRPEYLTAGTRLVFREGKTKGIGMVVGTE